MRQPHHRWLLRRGLVGLSALAALVPITAGATGPVSVAVGVNGLINTVVAIAPDGSFIDRALGAAAGQVTTCVIQTFINRYGIAAQGGDTTNCGNVVVSLTTQAKLCDQFVGCSASPQCTGTNSCSDTTPLLVPAPDSDTLTLTVWVTATARSGWGWGSLPPGCQASGSTMNCTITQTSPGLLSVVSVVSDALAAVSPMPTM